MKNFAILQLILLCAVVSVSAQNNFKITSNSAGGIRLGMTVNQARRALPACKFARESDGDGAALVGVNCGGKDLMSLYTGEGDSDSAVDRTRPIEFIDVSDSRFTTPDGIRTGMSLRKAERILGRVREIMLSEIESREFVTFAKSRKGLTYRTLGGKYAASKNRTRRYGPDAKILSIK